MYTWSNSTMEFVVGKALPPQNIPNSFSVEIKAYAGDADYYQSFSVDGFRKGEDEDLLENLVSLLRRLKTAYPHGRGGSREYSYIRVKGYEPWFSIDSPEYFEHLDGEDPETSKALAAEIEAFNTRVQNVKIEMGVRSNWPEWPYDSTCESECSLDKFQIFFYDENLVKHEVQIKE